MLTGKQLEEYVISVGHALRAELETILGDADQSDASRDDAVSLALSQCLHQLYLTGCEGIANQWPSSRFWAVTEQILSLGSLQLHARNKPLGYAGDHRLLDRICRGDVQGQGMAAAFDRFFQNQAAPAAVRSRGRKMATAIVRMVGDRGKSARAVGRRVSIASVGSGPAWDIRWALESLDTAARRTLSVTLIDLDPRALDFCEQSIGTILPAENLHLVRGNLKRLPRSSELLSALDGSDLVFCAGFFDYLDDAEAVHMLRALWGCVADDGELVAFNFAEGNPSRAYMEWIGNWYLTYRTKSSMERLASVADLAGAETEVGVEPAGVNLYWRFYRG